MMPLSPDQSMWLARGVALGHILRRLQLGLRAGARRLRTIPLARRLRELGLAGRRLPEG